jgi:tRNA (guanine37-N1)-methyltransferase
VSAAATRPRLSIDILTIFPPLVESYVAGSILGRAREDGVLEVRVLDLRAGADDPRRSVDDAPFGGGPGMVLAPGPVFEAVERARPLRPLLLLSPLGERFDHSVAVALAEGSWIKGQREGDHVRFSLLCGRYEGVDQRIVDHLVDGELSVGDYVLAGGELAALVVTEAVARLVPGVLGNVASASEESFTDGLLEYPQYTRPGLYRGLPVPEVLRSGDHPRIAAWRRAEALRVTIDRRPDLIERRGGITQDEARLLCEHGYPVHASSARIATGQVSPGRPAPEE